MATKDLETSPEPAMEVDSAATEAAPSSSKKRKTTVPEIEVDLTQPEPPSKKARRALKKGKTLPTKPQSGDEDDDEAEGKTKTGEAKKDDKKKERSPHGVWIGNLRFSVTKNDLRKWFIDNSGGAITDELITRVNLPTTKPVSGGPGPKKAAENRGFAYVDFATLAANVAAIALSETEWNGRKVLIKDSKSYEGRPKKEETAAADEDKTADGKTAATDAKKKNPSTKVFVGNLSFTTTEDDLQAHFEKCGKIRWVKVATFEDTGKCKGYGWVNFEEPEAAQWAVKGFVKIRETIDSLEDFMEKEDGEDGAKEAEGDSKPATKTQAEKELPRIKTRKWWVNQLNGRNLKIELAEDDQLRYAKRFKKGGQRNQEGGGGDGGNQKQNEEERTKPSGEKKKEYTVREKKPAYANDISVARLTGAAVAPQGKKTTFD
ncbi:hypothetical protein V8F06_001254 [Rhypophila decipiens]